MAQWVGVVALTEGSQVEVHAWVMGRIPRLGEGGCKRQLVKVSLAPLCFSPSLLPPFPSLKINKENLFFKEMC